MTLLAPVLLLAALLPRPVPGDAVGDEAPRPPAATGDEPASSPWYLERGTHPRTPGVLDDIPSVLVDLTALLRDDRVPGFYDGQFAATADRVDELQRLARDPAVNHVMRMMAVMALQEALDGPELAAQLEPLLIEPRFEFEVERDAFYMTHSRLTDEAAVRRELSVDLSRYARFALAKDGQPGPILDRIAVLEEYVARLEDRILDPSLRSDEPFMDVALPRQVWFEIGYHYQQFDDYKNATRWYRALTDALRGGDARWAHYNLACIAALQGRADEAMVELAAAAEDGFLDVDWMDEDGDLELLRERPDYAELRRRMLNEPGAAPLLTPGSADAEASETTEPEAPEPARPGAGDLAPLSEELIEALEGLGGDDG